MDQQKIIIYQTSDGQATLKLYAHEDTVWLNQKQLTKLFATSKQLT